MWRGPRKYVTARAYPNLASPRAHLGQEAREDLVGDGEKVRNQRLAWSLLDDCGIGVHFPRVARDEGRQARGHTGPFREPPPEKRRAAVADDRPLRLHGGPQLVEPLVGIVEPLEPVPESSRAAERVSGERARCR